MSVLFKSGKNKFTMFPTFIPKRRVQGKVVNLLGWPPLAVPRILLSSVDTCASMLGPLPRIPLWGSLPSRSPLAASNKTQVSYAHNYSNTIIALTSLNDVLKSHPLSATLPAWFGVLQKLISWSQVFSKSMERSEKANSGQVREIGSLTGKQRPSGECWGLLIPLQ